MRNRIANPDTAKKWMTCLGCGKKMWTDRCHRICKKCRRRNEATPVRSPYLVSLPRGYDLYSVDSRDRDDW
jgi:hypothetical protein